MNSWKKLGNINPLSLTETRLQLHFHLKYFLNRTNIPEYLLDCLING